MWRVFKGNLRIVVIVGLNKKTDQLRKYFNDNPDYGYQLVKIFDLKQYQNIEEIIKHISENDVDEIYSSIAEYANSISRRGKPLKIAHRHRRWHHQIWSWHERTTYRHSASRFGQLVLFRQFFIECGACSSFATLPAIHPLCFSSRVDTTCHLDE